MQYEVIELSIITPIAVCCDERNMETLIRILEEASTDKMIILMIIQNVIFSQLVLDTYLKQLKSKEQLPFSVSLKDI